MKDFIGLCIIMQYVVRSHLPLNEFPLITKASDWPVFFASAMYVFEGIALVCNEKKNMFRKKEKMGLLRFYQYDKK
jgi:hypothetical protein